MDAFVLGNGENVAQHVPEPQYKQLADGSNSLGEGWKVPPIPAEVFSTNSDDSDWVNRQCTVHPRECFEQRIKLTGGIEKILNITFILAVGFRENTPFPPFYERAKAKGWKTLTVPCGHEVMLDRPEELTKILLDASYETSVAAGATQ